MENNDAVISEPVKANFLVRLFSGEISLPVTYWVFGILLGSFVPGLFEEVVKRNYVEIIQVKSSGLVLKGFFWFIVAYNIFIMIAIWRSAGKHSGKKIWSGLARVAVVIGCLYVMGNLNTYLTQEIDEPKVQEALRASKLKEDLLALNKNLPSMVDKNTRIDRISLQGKDIYYNYTLVNHIVSNLDIDRFKAVMIPNLKTSECADRRAYLDDGRSLVYMYQDKQSNPVIKIVITKADCL